MNGPAAMFALLTRLTPPPPTARLSPGGRRAALAGAMDPGPRTF
jgi:hypothetical protein